MRLLGFIDRKRQVGVQLAEKEPRTVIAVDQVGVLSYPPDTGFFGDRLLENGRGSRIVLPHRARGRSGSVQRGALLQLLPDQGCGPQRLGSRVSGRGVRERPGRGWAQASAGAASGTLDLEGCLQEGTTAGNNAASACGHKASAVAADAASDESGAPLFTARMSLFMRGEGGFGGPSGPKVANEPPDRERLRARGRSFNLAASTDRWLAAIERVIEARAT